MTAEVRLGAWQDVLPGTYDPSRAVVITDPPYGLGDKGGKGYQDDVPWATHVRDVLELLPAVRHVIRGPASEIVRGAVPAPRRMCVEVATYGGVVKPATVPHRWQAWLVYGRVQVGRRGRAPLGDALIVHPYQDDGLRSAAADVHRGITPWRSALWIVELWTEPGWTVLDPYSGVATIGRAASTVGHAYIGAERDERWYREAQRSLQVTQPRLALGTSTT